MTLRERQRNDEERDLAEIFREKRTHLLIKRGESSERARPTVLAEMACTAILPNSSGGGRIPEEGRLIIDRGWPTLRCGHLRDSGVSFWPRNALRTVSQNRSVTRRRYFYFHLRSNKCAIKIRILIYIYNSRKCL